MGPRGRTGAGGRPPGDLLPLPAGCLSAPITASTIAGPFLLIDYDTREQFDLCLSNEVLKANLGALLEQPLTVEYLLVVKAKLEQVTVAQGRSPPAAPLLAWARCGTGRTCCAASPAAGMKAPRRVLCTHFCLLFPSLTLFSALLA